MPIYALGEIEPRIDPEAFVHPDAVLIGDVVIESRASVWPAAVLRGDYGHIEIREGSNIQDGTVIHAGPDIPAVVGPFGAVGHNAHLEGCTIEPWALVGSGATVLHRCVVRSHAIVAAGAIVLNDTEVPSYAMALGVPCRIEHDRVPEGANRERVEVYLANAERFRRELRRVA
jgi:carbonic anhydrase/acetyltransferase-like protein (isoleucine patch superfamily)